MRSDAYIRVTCDRCVASGDKKPSEIEIALTVIARRGYDEREVDRDLEDAGWRVIDGEDICDWCLENSANVEEETHGTSSL